MERVKIKLRLTPEHDFRATLDYREEQDGFLPAMPTDLSQAFQNWQMTYRQLDEVRSHIAPKPGSRNASAEASAPAESPAPRQRLTVRQVTHHSSYDHADEVKTQLNRWLNTEDSRWKRIREDLISIAGEFCRSGEQIPMLLDADDIQLRRLPWQEWDLFADYSFQTEIALRVKGHPGEDIKPPRKQRRVRILVVVGRSDGIRTHDDLALLKQLKKRGAEVVALIQPTVRELCKALWDRQGYHIFVFTGHSGSRADGQIGWIEVNEHDSLGIEELKHALKAAIDQGLQLAIFNSCDGLGLANQLAQLNLPRSIVMREPVPDDVAVEFLEHFFDAFSSNESLFTSLHRARQQLEHFNVPQEARPFYPGVMWLPTLCTRQSAFDQSLTWKGMMDPAKQIPVRSLTFSILGLALIGTLVDVCWRRSLCVPNPTPEATFQDVSVPQGTWRYGGSTTWAPVRGQVDPIIEQTHPEFNLVYTQHPTLPEGSGTGIQMVLNDQISFSQSSRPLNDAEYETARNRRFELKQVPVAVDGIAVVVHPDLPIERLTLQQVSRIYAGDITNWREVGGPDLEIRPLSRSPYGGTVEFFQENVLGDRNFADHVEFIDSTTLALRQVEDDAQIGAIYYASAPEVVPQCGVKPLPISRSAGTNPIAPYQGEFVPPEDCPNRRNEINLEAIQNEDYPLTRRLFVIIKQNDQGDEAAGEAYANLLLTREGQSLLEEAGFIPLR
ncbi:MAG: substrate-binding domain-containing protein [Synechococcales bacterium]|nr:substrate-binding domain-containing protein [Synechococcales bacterium]